MARQENDMAERYIYEVTRRVPKGQREEIQLELRELISDMMERDGAQIEEVLAELGNPKDFAQKYNGERQDLVGPEYYEDYCWVIKLFLASAAGLNLAAAVFQGAISPGHLLRVSFYLGTIMNIMVSLMGGFGLITFIFAVLERQNVKFKIWREKEWSVEQLKQWSPAILPPVPDEKARISRGDCIVGIVCTILFGIALAFAPEWAHWLEDTKVKVVVPFNLEIWHIVLPLLLANLCISLVHEIIKLMAGRYCTMVMASQLMSGAADIVFAIIVLGVLPFWNANFVEELEKACKIEIVSKGDLLFYWDSGIVSGILVAVIILLTLAETGVTVYKTLRYGKV